MSDSPEDGKSPEGGQLPSPQKYEGYFTLSNGCPIKDPLSTEQAEEIKGPHRYASQLIQSINVIDTISHLTRERIPERYVHAKGVGAFGKFIATGAASHYSDAEFLKAGTETRLFSRFSTVGGEKGYPDTLRDTKGMAFKLYTTKGNLDWAFFQPEIFFIRDPHNFPSLVHATKRDPASNLLDPDMFWDYFNNHPEGYNCLMRLFSDYGTPQSFSQLTVSSVNTYTFTKQDDTKQDDADPKVKKKFIRIRMEPRLQSDKYFTLSQAITMAGHDPDYLARRLHHEIRNGPKPEWKVFAQILKAPGGNTNAFDATKVIPDCDIETTIEIGSITLTETPENSFTQVEMAAFNPANVVPGWDISPDPILQIRLFAYGDAQRYRLGVNNDQLPTNKPISYVWSPTRRDGAYNISNYGNTRNYIRRKETTEPQFSEQSYLCWEGKMVSFANKFDDVYEQPRKFWNENKHLTAVANLPGNVAAVLSGATIDVRQETLDIFKKISEELRELISRELNERSKTNQNLKKKPGVTLGDDTRDHKHYVRPVVPDPATKSVVDAFDSVWTKD